MQTIVIIEPHPLFRLGLRQLLSDALPQIIVEDRDYSSLEESATPSTTPCDLLVLSLTSSQCSNKLSHAAVKQFSPARILLMADANDMPGVSSDLPECVAGAVPKDAPPEILQASVRLVLAGGNCFPARPGPINTIAQRMVSMSTSVDATRSLFPSSKPAPSAATESERPTQITPGACNPILHDTDAEFSAPMKPGSAAHRESRLLGLTPRQYEVLVLLARGYPMKTVGRALNISVATAKAHTETLYQRLDVHNRNAAVYAAVSRGATLGWAQKMGAQRESAH